MSRTIPGTSSQAAGRPSSPSPAAPARPAYWPGPESPLLWGHATRGRERRRGRRGNDVSIVYPIYVQTSTCHALLNVRMLYMYVVCTLKFEVPGLLMKSHQSFRCTQLYAHTCHVHDALTAHTCIMPPPPPPPPRL